MKTGPGTVSALARTSNGRSQSGRPASKNTACSFDTICTAMSSCLQSSPLLTITGRSLQHGKCPYGDARRRRATLGAHFSAARPGTNKWASQQVAQASKLPKLARLRQSHGRGSQQSAGQSLHEPSTERLPCPQDLPLGAGHTSSAGKREADVTHGLA